VTGIGAALALQGQRLVFLSVFLQQIGVPVPAEPTLVVAGSLAARGRLSISGIALAAMVATLAADLTWFAVGKRYGRRALHLIFRLSSSPAKYVSQAERVHVHRPFEWGNSGPRTRVSLSQYGHVGAWMAREGGVGRLIYALKSRSRPRGGVHAIAAS
jgi:hypothetical protein